MKKETHTKRKKKKKKDKMTMGQTEENEPKRMSEMVRSVSLSEHSLGVQVQDVA